MQGSRKLEGQNSSESARIRSAPNLEAESTGQPAHASILRQDVGDDARDIFRARDLNQLAEQFRAQASVLKSVGDEDGDLRIVPFPTAAKPADTEDFVMGIAGIAQIGDERHFPVVVDEALAHQAIVGDARAQFFHVEITQIYALIGK